MSEFQKSFAKAKLAKLPPEAPMAEAIPDVNETQDEEGSSASSLSSTGTLVPSPTRHLFARKSPRLVLQLQLSEQFSGEIMLLPENSNCPRKKKNKLTRCRRQSSESLPWTDFFSQELFLPEVLDGIHIIHHAYLTPPTTSGPLFVMHHGAGSSGLSFATCAEEIRKILPKAGVLSLDARGHGLTTITTNARNIGTENPSAAEAAQKEVGEQIELDLSLSTLSRDLIFIIRQTQQQMDWETMPDIVLVGHSLGGAVITDAAKNGELGAKLLAYAVLDVVEGKSTYFPVAN